ncbi:hypothetical protein A7J67_08435 [Achromobacter xylosoxidans]|nr:hypothetical protein A7J67_08435 [Achromobacter xylosoxidans]
MTISADDAALHAMRMKNFEQGVADAERLNLTYGYMHFSALSATTRKSHAERHGKLFTAEQVRSFWSDPENIAGCKCTIIGVMLGEDGEPIVSAFLENARASYEKMAARGYEWSK